MASHTDKYNFEDLYMEKGKHKNTPFHAINFNTNVILVNNNFISFLLYILNQFIRKKLFTTTKHKTLSRTIKCVFKFILLSLAKLICAIHNA